MLRHLLLTRLLRRSRIRSNAELLLPAPLLSITRKHHRQLDHPLRKLPTASCIVLRRPDGDQNAITSIEERRRETSRGRHASTEAEPSQAQMRASAPAASSFARLFISPFPVACLRSFPSDHRT